MYWQGGRATPGIHDPDAARSRRHRTNPHPVARRIATDPAAPTPALVHRPAGGAGTRPERRPHHRPPRLPDRPRPPDGTHRALGDAFDHAIAGQMLSGAPQVSGLPGGTGEAGGHELQPQLQLLAHEQDDPCPHEQALAFFIVISDTLHGTSPPELSGKRQTPSPHGSKVPPSRRWQAASRWPGTASAAPWAPGVAGLARWPAVRRKITVACRTVCRVFMMTTCPP